MLLGLSEIIYDWDDNGVNLVIKHIELLIYLLTQVCKWQKRTACNDKITPIKHTHRGSIMKLCIFKWEHPQVGNYYVQL